MLQSKPSAVICVLDATNLESSLHLLTQVLEYDLPVLAVLNKQDLAQKRNTDINHDYLQSVFQIPITPTVATTGEGFQALLKKLFDVVTAGKPRRHIPDKQDYDRWQNIENIIAKAVRMRPGADSGQKQDILIKPWPGIPIAIALMAVMFATVIGLGMGLRQFVLLPFLGIFCFRNWKIWSMPSLNSPC